MISDFCPHYFKIFVKYLSRLEFRFSPVFLFPKSANIFTIFPNSVEKIGLFRTPWRGYAYIWCPITDFFLALDLRQNSSLEKSETVRQVKIRGNTFLWSYVVRCGVCRRKFQLRPDGDTIGRLSYFDSRKYYFLLAIYNII